MHAMPERYKVRVTKDHLVFCSGHFISYEGDKCERLHGHNYRATVEIEGELDENYYVFDFIALKNRTKALVDELDHRMMLATKNPFVQVEAKGQQVHVKYREHYRRVAGSIFGQSVARGSVSVSPICPSSAPHRGRGKYRPIGNMRIAD